MTPREQVLSTIRRSLGVTGGERPRLKEVADRLNSHPRGVLPARATTLSPRARIKLFIEMAEASAATVSVVRDPAEAPTAIADFLRAHNLAPLLRRGPDPRLDALPFERTAIEVSVGRTYGDDPAGLSAAFGAVAETGTAVLVSGADNPTTLNFLPDNHIVLVDAATISATYEDIWDSIRASYGAGIMPRTVNWITGPSRSADIEQILLMGAHGPRRLHIVLVDPEAEVETEDLDATLAAGGSTPAEPRVGSTLAVDPESPDEGPEPPASGPRETTGEHAEEQLDESFPASDPPSLTQP
ncbi:lactate utilization protein C [Hansschlegelia quercus]|uniref:Lactate utilization protein n=1 Tax=Hansschlegelia quercus TaxID=2528245 RepID=A0A4Q9GLF5_9HYPH|nr:lactate utilization protein [Hansschlegelia quercus]TBN55098.1 lactate utilization protein [Hansschlegelia quercus]